ncbi:hypothetical protein Tco_0155551 [Tanacetum coccineum]
MEISSDREFLGPAPSYVYIRDPVRRLCHKMIACSISSRGQGAEKVTGVDLFYLRTMDRRTANVLYLLAHTFRLVSDQGLRGLSVVAWVPPGPERQQAAVASAPGAVEDTPIADEGAQAVPKPVQAPQPSPPAP